MQNTDVALLFLKRFSSGDIEGLEELLQPDMVFDGPYLTADNRAQYLQALRDQPPLPSFCEVLHILNEDEKVAIFYDYKKPDSCVRIAQMFIFEQGKISKMRLVF